MSKVVSIVKKTGGEERTVIFYENEGGLNVEVKLPDRTLLASLGEHLPGLPVNLVLTYENCLGESESVMTLNEGEEEILPRLGETLRQVSIRHERG